MAPNGLVIIGDSLSRYQYLNLVNFLEHGTWVTDPTHLKPSENEHKFDGGRVEFYQITNQRLGWHEICDCYRGNGILENRYYINGDVKVSYMKLFGSDSHVLVHDTSLMNISSCVKSTCVQGFASLVIAPLSPSRGTILQPGTLRRMFASVAPIPVHEMQALLDEARKIRVDSPTVQLHWKMTTALNTGMRQRSSLHDLW